MNYFDFDNSSLEDKAKFVWENALFIESILHYNQRINLYSLNKEFIEVYYQPFTNDIVRISFATEQDLKKYISAIKLPF